MSTDKVSSEEQNQSSCLGGVICSCYMCSKVIDGKENEFDMYGEIVCGDCWDYNQYQALRY